MKAACGSQGTKYGVLWNERPPKIDPPEIYDIQNLQRAVKTQCNVTIMQCTGWGGRGGDGKG